MEVNITSKNFEEEVNQETPILLDFWASWCGPCMRQGPIVEKMAEKGYRIGKVNVDEEMILAQQFQIVSIPTLMIFKNGKPVQQFIGLTSMEKLTEAMDAHA